MKLEASYMIAVFNEDHIGDVNYETGEAHHWDETFASSIKVGEWGILNNFEHLSIQNSASSRGALQFRIT